MSFARRQRARFRPSTTCSARMTPSSWTHMPRGAVRARYASCPSAVDVRAATTSRARPGTVAHSLAVHPHMRAVHVHIALPKRGRAQGHGRADNQAGYREVPRNCHEAWRQWAADLDIVSEGQAGGKSGGRVSESEGSGSVGEVEPLAIGWFLKTRFLAPTPRQSDIRRTCKTHILRVAGPFGPPPKRLV